VSDKITKKIIYFNIFQISNMFGHKMVISNYLYYYKLYKVYLKLKNLYMIYKLSIDISYIF